MKFMNRFKARKGITLVELALVLALAAIVVFVALRAFSQAQENSRVQQTASEIGQVRGAVESVYANVSSFSTITAASIAPSLPASFVSGTGTSATVTNPYQGSVTVVPDKVVTDGDSYDIIIGGLNIDACTRLATLDQGRSLVNVAAAAGTAPTGSDPVSTAPLGTLPVSPSVAVTACSGTAAAGNYVGYQFH